MTAWCERLPSAETQAHNRLYGTGPVSNQYGTPTWHAPLLQSNPIPAVSETPLTPDTTVPLTAGLIAECRSPVGESDRPGVAASSRQPLTILACWYSPPV